MISGKDRDGLLWIPAKKALRRRTSNGLTDTSDAATTVIGPAHHAMSLFAGGRGMGLRRFLVAKGFGEDARF
jgi:hypothetical protein